MSRNGIHMGPNDMHLPPLEGPGTYSGTTWSLRDLRLEVYTKAFSFASKIVRITVEKSHTPRSRLTQARPLPFFNQHKFFLLIEVLSTTPQAATALRKGNKEHESVSLEPDTYSPRAHVVLDGTFWP